MAFCILNKNKSEQKTGPGFTVLLTFSITVLGRPNTLNTA